MIAWAGPAGCLAILCGLTVRRRLGACYSFVAYLLAVAASDLLVLLWPDQFFRQTFWLGKELAITVCRLGIAVELGYRISRAFPGARSTARGALLLSLWVTLLIVAADSYTLAPQQEASALAPLLSHLQPRLLNGTIWLLTAVALLALWYRLPVEPLQKAILSGYVPYLLVFTTGLSLLGSAGWRTWALVEYVDATAYLVLLAYWTAVAWRKTEVEPRPAGSLRALPGAVG